MGNEIAEFKFFTMPNVKTTNNVYSKIMQDLVDNCIESGRVRRYQVEKPDLDDVRFGFARVNSKGCIKWIPENKLTKKYKQILRRNGYFLFTL